MVRGQSRLALPNPHGSQDIEDALLMRILRQAGVTRQEFEQARRAR